MKKLTKILIIALSIALLCGAFIFSASANEAATAPEATTVNAFRVQNPDEQAVEVVTIAQAFSAVKTGGTITMIADYEDGANHTAHSLASDKKNVTLDLNGHTFTASYCEWYNEEKSAPNYPVYQKLSIYGSLTVVGNGTMKLATSILVGTGGTLTFNAGEGNTINLVAFHGYHETKELSATNFPGGDFIKVGANTPNSSPATLNVKGNLSFTDLSEKTNIAFIAYSDNSVINLENADIDCINNGAGSGFLANHFSGTYDEATYTAPVITIEDSVIDAPYGTFFEAINMATSYSDAVCLTVTDSTLNLVGDKFPTAGAGGTSAVVLTNNASPVKVVMTGTKVYTDTNFFYNPGKDIAPLATVQIDDCFIDIKTATAYDDGTLFADHDSTYNWNNTYNYRRYFFYGPVTAAVENTVYKSGGSGYISNVIINTHAWANADTAKTRFTDPGYFDELGMGVLFKEGTAFVNCRGDALATAVAAGTYATNFGGYAFDYGCALATDRKVAVEGDVYTGKLLTASVKNINFADAKVGTTNVGDALSDGGFFGTGLDASAMITRNGKYTICEYAGNKYLTHSARAGNGSYNTDPYFGMAFTPGSAGNYTHAIDTARFYTFEMDIAKAAMKHSQGNFNIGFLFRTPDAHYVNVTLSTNANGVSSWKIGGVTGAKSYTAVTFTDAPIADAGVWQHVQVIIEAPVTVDGAFDTANAANFNIHLYLDGVSVGSAALADANPDLATAISSATNLKAIALTEIRYKFPTSYVSTDTGSTAMDNFFAARYPLAYSGNATTNEAILASVVNTNYERLESMPLAKVDGVDYSDLDAAIEKLIELAKGGYVPTFEYEMDLSNYTFNLSGAASGAKFIFKTGDKALKLASGYTVYSGALADQLGEGETLVVPAKYNSVDIKHTQTMQDGIEGSYTDGEGNVLLADGSAGGSFGGTITGSIASRNGKYTIREYNGNKYFTHVAQNNGNNDPMISLGFDAGTQSSGYTHPLNQYRFYSYELDFASAALKHSEGSFSFRFLLRSGATVSGTFKETFFGYVEVHHTTDADGNVTWKIGNKKLTDTPVEKAGVWQHAQVIIEAPVVEYNEGSYKYSAKFDEANVANLQIHLYLDGVLAGTATLKEASQTLYNNLNNSNNYDSLKNVAFTETRFRFPADYVEGDTGSTAFDNFRVERYPINYTADATSGADLLASIVRTDSSRFTTAPTDLPLVNVDGTGYNNIADAVAALKDGSTLEYVMDVSSVEFDLSAFKSGETFTFKTKGAAPKLNALALYGVDDNDDGTYTVRPATADEKATMTWYNKDGSVLLTQTVLKGQELQMYVNPNPEVIVNDYYKATYDAWKLDDNTFLVKGGTETVILNADRSAYSAATLESTFTDVKFNVGLNDNLVTNFFVPQEIIAKDGTGADGVTFVGVLINAEKPTNGKYTAKYSALEIGGKGYDLFVGYPGYHAFANNAYCIVTYTVTLDGLTYTLAPKFEITPLAYAEIVLDEENTAFVAEDKTHVANLLRFSNEFIRAKNGAYDTSVNGVYEIYKDLCTAYEEDLLAETDVADLENDPIWDYVSAIYVKVSNGRAQYSIDFKADSKVTAVEIWKTHADGSFAKIGVYEPQNKKFDGTSYYSNYNTANLRFYDFFGTLEIRLTVDGKDDQVIGHYDVNTWYNNAEMTEAEKAIWGDFLMALKELGDTFYDYRFRLPVSEEE